MAKAEGANQNCWGNHSKLGHPNSNVTFQTPCLLKNPVFFSAKTNSCRFSPTDSSGEANPLSLYLRASVYSHQPGVSNCGVPIVRGGDSIEVGSVIEEIKAVLQIERAMKRFTS